jgi:hypothetical protein
MATFKLGRIGSRGRQTKLRVAQNIEITQQQHDDLLKHMTDRMDGSLPLRDQEVDKYEFIDRDLYGYLIHDFEDQQREKDNRLGHGLKPTDVKLPLVFAQLDEALTFLLTVLAPDESMYNAVAPKEHQDVAKGFVVLMNRHAEIFGHFRNYAKFLFNCMRYNIGGYDVEWREIIGSQLTNASTTVANAFQRGVVETGNAVTSLDMYNTFYDISVHPVELPIKGEYFATVHMHTPFRYEKMEADGEAFGVDRFKNAAGQKHYYKEKPRVRSDMSLGQAITDWVQVLSLGQESSATLKGIERVRWTGWINPRKFGLAADNELQLWRINFVDKTHIINTQQLNNAHGMLPAVMAMPIEDDFLWGTKAYSEYLFPYQTFASYQVNVHQRAARKRLYGLTIYDEKVIPFMDQDDIDLAGGKIPANTAGQDMDLNKKIVQFTDGPDTSRTLDDVERMDALMQKILPTDLLRQVASLERATQYQSAATVQGANRRNLKIAKTVNSQAMDPGRRMQMYNIYQFQQSVQILGPDGTLIDIDPRQFRDARLEFAVSDGLKGLDRLMLIMNIKEVLNAILQSQTAAQRFDVASIIDHWTSLLGDHTDFTQFRIRHPLDGLPPEQKDAALQLLQQALQQGPRSAATGA